MYKVTKHIVGVISVTLHLKPENANDTTGGAPISLQLVPTPKARSITEGDLIAIKEGKVLWTPVDVNGYAYAAKDIECTIFTNA